MVAMMDKAMAQPKWQSRTDLQQSVRLYMVELYKVLKALGGEEVRSRVSKELIQRAMEKIGPMLLRMKVQKSYTLWTSKEKKSIDKLFEMLLELAKEVERNPICEPSRGNTSAPVTLSKGKDTYAKKSGGKSDLKPSGEIKKGLKCLNAQCNGYHRLKDCPITDKDLAKSLLKEHRSKRHDKRNDSAGKVNRVQLQPPPPKTTEILLRSKYAVEPDGDYDCWAAVLPGGVEERLRADSGNTAGCVMSMSVAKQLVASGKAHLVELAHPVRLVTAAATVGKSGPKVRWLAKWVIACPVDVQLRHGPLRIPKRQWFVLEEDMDELLIDRTTLKELGVDVGTVLEQARVRQLDQARASQEMQLYIPAEEMRPKSKDDVLRKQAEFMR
jgi:hypothetical protein